MRAESRHFGVTEVDYLLTGRHLSGYEDLTRVGRWTVAWQQQSLTARDSRLNLYRIVDVVPIRGTPPVGLRNGWSVMRVESLNPFSDSELVQRNSSGLTFYGETEELHYTSKWQRRELEQMSRPEFEPSNKANAVLIPLAKGAEWWQLGQDERQVHFQQSQDSEGHTAIGLRYVDRVYRRLYHSRHLLKRPEYDFLTYFEFHEADAPAFRALLADLRDSTRNPEWRYVTLEFEIWMRKVA